MILIILLWPRTQSLLDTCIVCRNGERCREGFNLEHLIKTKKILKSKFLLRDFFFDYLVLDVFYPVSSDPSRLVFLENSFEILPLVFSLIGLVEFSENSFSSFS